MKMPTMPSNTDLRSIASQSWGHPLASSHRASLWWCPCCECKSSSLIVVTADQFRCLGRCGVRGGLVEMKQLLGVTDENAPSLEIVEAVG